MGLSITHNEQGLRLACLHGRWLQSRREPQVEADRFLAASLSRSPGWVLAIGPGIGYLFQSIRKAYPAAKILSAQLDSGFRGQELYAAELSWYPDSGEGLDAFILRNLEPAEAQGLELILWEPAAAACPDIAQRCLEQAKKAISTLTGSAQALSRFGPSLILNPFKTLTALRLECRLVHPVTQPIIVAAPGPSLEDQVPWLRARREEYFLLAVSSALRCLLSAGIIPDMAVCTDSGYWAERLLPAELPESVPIVAPLKARFSRGFLERRPLLPLNFGSLHEENFFSHTRLEGISLQEMGTVSITALHLALGMGSGPVAFAGLDMADLGLREHARPHAFDSIRQNYDDRLRPWHSEAGKLRLARPRRLVGSWEKSVQLSTYEAYFERNAGAFSGRVFRLRSSAPEIAGLTDIDPEALLSSGPVAGAPKLFQSKCFETQAFALSAARLNELIANAAQALGETEALLNPQAKPRAAVRELGEWVSLSALMSLNKARREGNEVGMHTAKARYLEALERIQKRLASLVQSEAPNAQRVTAVAPGEALCVKGGEGDE
jgi:hypothetical protein